MLLTLGACIWVHDHGIANIAVGVGLDSDSVVFEIAISANPGIEVQGVVLDILWCGVACKKMRVGHGTPLDIARDAPSQLGAVTLRNRRESAVERYPRTLSVEPFRIIE